MTKAVIVLGTGIMGAGMARSLLRAGFDVTVWNRTHDKAAPLAAACRDVVPRSLPEPFVRESSHSAYPGHSCPIRPCSYAGLARGRHVTRIGAQRQ